MKIELVKVLNGIAVSNKFYPDFFYKWCEQPEDKKRPNILVGKSKRYLKDNIHNWLESYGVRYILECSIKSFKNDRTMNGSWIINIPDKDIAILFKLTWM